MKKETIQKVINFVITVLTAVLSSFCVQSCVYHHYSVPTILQVVTRICFRKKLFYYRF